MKRNRILLIGTLVAAVVITVLIIDNVPRDYRNEEKLAEYYLYAEDILKKYPDILEKREKERQGEVVEWTKEDWLEMSKMSSELCISCYSVDEIREYMVLTNRLARQLSHANGCIYVCPLEIP